MIGINFPDVLIVRLGATIDRGDVLLDHVDEASGDVPALAFRLEDYTAAMRRACIGAEHHEEIRKVRYRESEIGCRVVVGPRRPEILAVTPADVETCRHLRDLEAGGDHDDVGRPQLAVGSNDAVLYEMVDLVGD